MEKLKGDLVELAKQGKFQVIVHGCNCFCTMGAGIAKQIKKHFPEAFKADLATQKGDSDKLGDLSSAECKVQDGKSLIVVNGYTQFHWKGSGRKVDYKALRQVFKKVKSNYSGQKIAYPAIGAGLAGGDWEKISLIIEEELEGENHVFVEFQS